MLSPLWITNTSLLFFIYHLELATGQGNGSGSSTGIAQRARHPEELKKDNGNWIIDIDYYLSQQVCLFPWMEFILYPMYWHASKFCAYADSSRGFTSMCFHSRY